jgi:cysteine-rich protein 2-binding protein
MTLHVSVTNPALLLYQKFGFKTEEFIVNFYDKYMATDEKSLVSKNAFFIRLKGS